MENGQRVIVDQDYCLLPATAFCGRHIFQILQLVAVLGAG